MTPAPPPHPIFRAPHFQILKIDHLIPSNPDQRYRPRALAQIKRVIVHHTAGPVIDGWAGPAATARTHTKERKWPGIGYHFFVPYNSPASDGTPTAYLTQPLRAWAYHTGPGWNQPGIGVACQGCFSSRHDPDQGPIRAQPTQGPSYHQYRALWALWGYLCDRFPGLKLYGHFDAGKTTCPGDDLEHWIRLTRGEEDSLHVG